MQSINNSRIRHNDPQPKAHLARCVSNILSRLFVKKTFVLLPLIFVAQLAMAALPYYDSFGDQSANGGTTYAVGSALANQQNNSTNIWNPVNTIAGGPQPVIAAGNLSSPNLPASIGNSVSFVPAITTNQGVRLNFFATNTSGATYYSYVLKLTNISAVPFTNANNFFAGFSDGSTAQPNAPVARIGTRLLTKATNSGFVFGVGRNNTPSDYVYDTNIHNLNESIFIVGSYELVGGVTNVNLWINPPTNTFGSNAVPTPTVSAPHFTSTTGNLSATGVQGFIIMCQNTNAPAGVMDEIRIGTNWSSVTGGDPSILTQPANTAKAPGANATFNVAVRGTAPFTYQWRKNGAALSDGGNILGAATASLTVSGISGSDVATYSVLITNALGAGVQSVGATLSLLTDPAITNQPQSSTVNYGSNAVFQVGVSGTGPITYQWHKENVGDLSDGGNISGSHSNILTLTGVAFADGGNYSVTIDNVNGSVDSSTATLTVNDPLITTQPVSQSVGAGNTAVFHVAAIGSGGSFSYQWFKNNTFLFDFGNASGTLTDTLTITNASSTDQASYYVTVIGSSSTATSSIVSLSVASPVTITNQPNPRTVAPGVNTAFVVAAGGSGPYQYQWQLSGSNISGATSNALVLTNVQSNIAGNYRAVVSNSFSAVTSSVVALTISSNLTLSSNNVMVVRVGDGAQTLTLNGNSVYLDQYDTSGNYINTVTVPDSGASALIAIGVDNASGVNNGSTTGTCLTRSLDGRFMVIAGYATNLSFNANLSTSTSTTVPRGVGLIESHAQFTLPVKDSSTNFTGTFYRAAVSDGSNNFWGGGGTAGTFYYGFSASPTLIQTNMPNMRSMSIYNGDIYCAGAVAGSNGVLKVSGMPQTATNGTFLFGGSSGTFDMAVNPAGNLIYVADQRAIGASGGGILRYDFNGTAWALTYTLQVGGAGSPSHGPRYITGDFSGASPVLYVTSNDGTFDNNQIFKVVDTGSGSTGTPIAIAGANQTFRGICFGPVPNTAVARPTLAYTTTGNNIVLSWTGAFFLQSSTNVTGTYSDIVPTATNPYTNSFGSASKKFFRLRQ